MSQKIKIFQDGETRFTSGNRARRFVRDGRATWIDETRTSIRFRSKNHSHKSVVALMERPPQPHHSTSFGYEIGCNEPFSNLTKLRRGVAEVPMIGDATRLLVRLTKRGPGLIGARI